MAKRLFDIVIVIILLIILFPVLLLTGLIVKLDSPGPVIFKQNRVGKGGEPFVIYKFRTMQNSLLNANNFQTDRNDQRLTRTGKFLRLLSLDELPQFFNILFGDMSLIGPRPDVEQQKSLYTADEFRLRHSVRPGLTGLAQVRARHECTSRQRTKYDLFYVRKSSLLFDFKIIFLTIRCLLKGDR